MKTCLGVLLISFLAESCGQNIVLKGALQGRESEIHAIMSNLGKKIGADVATDLASWQVEIWRQGSFVTCGGAENAIGCTEIGEKQAWITIAMAPPMTLEQSALEHEFLHVWLAATTGDPDQDHASGVWAKLRE